MTTYVLNSGGWRNYPDRAKEFFAEVFKNSGNNPKVLVCLFAMPRDEWDVKYDQNIERIRKVLPEGIAPTFTLAEPASFPAQVMAADIVYITGGVDQLVLHWLKQFDLAKIFEGKTVATSSASSHALSTHFWSADWRMCLDGLGILPIKFLAHFKSAYGSTDKRGPIDWDAAKAELEKCGDPKLPIHAMEEGRFVVLQS